MTLSTSSPSSGLLKQGVKVFPGGRRSLMLAGITQDIFLKEWGTPEIQIGLDHLEGFYKKEAIAVESVDPGASLYSVWIYKGRNRIFFFTKKRLVSHFKWSEFKEKRILPLEEASPRSVRKRAPFSSWMTAPLSWAV